MLIVYSKFSVWSAELRKIVKRNFTDLLILVNHRNANDSMSQLDHTLSKNCDKLKHVARTHDEPNVKHIKGQT